MSWISLTVVLLAVSTVIYGRRHYAGGRNGHYDEPGIYCNYYTTDPWDGTKTIGSVLCKYGCCGSLDDQRCCSKDGDSDEDDNRSSGGKSVTFVLAGLLSMVALVVLVSCALWCYKRNKARRCKTSHSDLPRPIGRPTGLIPRGRLDPTAPPKYSVTPRPGHALAPGPHYNLFTVNTPPPAYTTVASAPPIYQLPDLPPYSRIASENPDNLENNTRTPPPPYTANLNN